MRKDTSPKATNGPVESRETAASLVELARAAEQGGAPMAALAHYAEALDLVSDGEHEPDRADIIRWKGTVRRELGDTSEAEALYRKSLEISESCGYGAGQAHAINCLAIIAQRKGDVDAAATLYRRGARLAGDACAKPRWSLALRQEA